MSRDSNDGDCSTCHTIAGTPPNVVTRSRSISSSARSASHLCISTSLPPAATLATRTEWQPVAWKNGTDSRYTFWPGRGAPASLPGAHLRAPGREREREEVAADVAVRAERALRPARRARRVEDRREVLGLEVDVGQRRRRRAPSPSTSSHRSARAGARSSARATTIVATSSAGSTSASRSSRSASTNTTLAPESRRPYSSSSAVHHAFSGTTIAPAAAAAQNAIDHSGKLRITIATRSPFSTP